MSQRRGQRPMLKGAPLRKEERACRRGNSKLQRCQHGSAKHTHTANIILMSSEADSSPTKRDSFTGEFKSRVWGGGYGPGPKFR